MAISKFQHKDCAITVSALFLSGPKRWRPHLVIVRLRENAKLAREQAITDQPALFSRRRMRWPLACSRLAAWSTASCPGLRV